LIQHIIAYANRKSKFSLSMPGLLRLPVKLLLSTRNELGGYLDSDEKDVFGVNSKALCPRSKQCKALLINAQAACQPTDGVHVAADLQQEMVLPLRDLEQSAS
jgi:hypothetical protein